MFYCCITRELTTFWFKNIPYIFKLPFSAYTRKTNYEVDLRKHSSPNLKNVMFGLSDRAFTYHGPGFNPLYHTTITLTGMHWDHTHTHTHTDLHTHTLIELIELSSISISPLPPKPVFKLIPIKKVGEMA